MAAIPWLMSKTMKGTFLSKKSWFIYFLLPLVGIVISMFMYGNTSSGNLRIGIVNADGQQAVTQDLIRFIEGLNGVKVTITDDVSLKKDIAAGKLDSGIRVANGFGASLQSGSPQSLEILSIKGAQVTAYVKSMLENYTHNIAAIGKTTKGDAVAFDRIYGEYQQQNFRLSTETLKDTSHTKAVTYQSLGFLIAFMMFSAVNLSELILKEKENRTFLRLLTSPVTARAYVAANVAVNAIVMLLQIIVTLFFLKRVFHVDTGIPYGEMLLILLLFGLTAIGLSLLIVSFAKSSSFAGALQNLIITPTCLLAGCYFPMDIMPDSIRKVSNFLPQHWLLDTVNRLQNGEAFSSVYLNLAILIAFAAAFSLIAVYRFSRNNDTRIFV